LRTINRSRFGEEQIVGTLREQEAGAAEAVCPEHWINSASF